MIKRKTVSKIVVYILLALFAAIFLFPIYWAVVTSFKTYREAFTQPPKLITGIDLTNYIKFFSQNDLVQLLLNSVIVALCSVLIPLVLGLFAAYALDRSTLKGKEALGMFLLASRFIPPISTLIPTYILFRKFGLYDTLTGLILLNCAMNIPYVVWMMRGFIADIPESLEESAWIDGCGRLQAFFRIVLPMLKSGLGATGVLIFVFTWNEYMFAMNLSSSNAKTLPLAMMTYMGEAGIEWNMMATAGVIILLPAVILSIFANKNLGSGMTLGAVKG
ncbi:carbohydrate ABC transporter permease [Sediminispirochaeta smaragdinae]|jgi:multiple sugar transport system permease protein|uniref:Maltose/maltodextrin transport system permease protein MalG n=1 Tax=Sediminispirochaeta smaragdinae (strain DSM 11293 / JCM 15392 / SEBR 4228) TaxID=573413 RepID=E1R325_SEDSS|nr:carbohydrate ABC transporter permease [Sediminispirochaeta smaragdinae]ADK81211.1 binding-protein-dependent transport systems inner membrane component [Sediminispirochaeta smaragdinae DSM 11293]